MRKPKKKALKYLLSTSALLIGLYLCFYIYKQQVTLNKMNETYQNYSMELKKLKEDHRQMNQEIINLQDDEYLSRVARKEYFLSKEGEIIFILPEKQGDK